MQVFSFLKESDAKLAADLNAKFSHIKNEIEELAKNFSLLPEVSKVKSQELNVGLAE